jgi:trehalose 2-sulfotransferase
MMRNLLRGAFPVSSVLRADTIKAAAGRSRLYVIFLTPRSGSTWLTELAMNTGALGVPHEWFNDTWIYTDEPALGCLPPRSRGIAEVNEYVDAIVDEGQGIAGLQLSVFQAAMLQEMIDCPFDLRWLKACFYLRRRDLAAQAVSLYRSVVSGRFHSYQSTPQHIQAFEAVEYDHDSILKWLRFLIECEQRFSELFRSCRIRPISLFYEDLLADPLGMLRQIARGIDVMPPQSLPSTTLSIMRDGANALWREQLAKNLSPDIVEWIEHKRFE